MEAPPTHAESGPSLQAARTLLSSPTSRSIPTSTVRLLQRLAGNAAVASLISRSRRRAARPRSRPVVQRYGSAEHKELGEAATTRTLTLALWTGPPNPVTQTKKVTLSYGVYNALLGDFYHGWEQLKKAPAPEVERLAALIQQEQTNRSAGKPGPADADYEQATAGRRAGAVQPGGATKTYLELAEDNVDHFTAANREHFTRTHKDALAKALEAFTLTGKGDTAGAQAAATDAFGLNAEADHFLEDAFAAGHLVNKPMIQLATLQFWTSGIARVAGDNLRAAAAADQARIWREIETHVLPQLSGPQAFVLRRLDRTDAINRVLNPILDRLQDQPDKLANLGAKLVHDHLNSHGVLVFNEADPATGWRTFGDNFLAKGVTAAKVVAALKASVGNIELAVRQGIGTVGGKADIDAFLRLNNPWRLAPKWAEIPSGQKREVGVAVSDPSWVQDLLRTLVFRSDVSSPLYQLLVENLALVGGILQDEERTTTARRTAQASAVDALLRKHSRSFAAGGRPDDANVETLARSLRGATPDLFVSVLDRLERVDLDDDLALEFAELHPTRAGLVALDRTVLMAISAAMSGGYTRGSEAFEIDRIKTALIVKTGQHLMSQLPAKERASAKKMLATLHAQGDERAAVGGDAGDLVASTGRNVYKPKDLAVAAKGRPAAEVLGAIDSMIFSEERAKWLVPFAGAHSDAEVAALDVALVDSLAKHLPPGAQQRRYAKALADATKAGAIATTTADTGKGAALVARFRFTDHPGLARKLEGRSPALVAAALSDAGDDRAEVAAAYVRQLSDDDLAKLDPALLHQLPSWVTDPGQLARVRTALSASLAGSATRSGI